MSTNKDALASWLFGAGITLSGAAAVAFLTLSNPVSGKDIALVFAPDATGGEMLDAVKDMDGYLLAPGGLANILIARFDAAVDPASLRRHGVILTFDPGAVAVCGPPLSSSLTSSLNRSRVAT